MGRPLRIMLDTQIYDFIVDTEGMTDRLNKFSVENRILILATHIQEDELVKIPDDRKRRAINEIVREKVVTSGAVWGVSKWGEATWGDGGSGGISIDEVRSPSKKHTKDALIATSAAKDADVIVTEDRRLAKRMLALSVSCEVWGFERFREYIFSS